jgi:methylated-DNA-[protein]-cysteine S-methyltransferase
MTDARPSAITVARFATPIGVALLATDEAGVLRAFNWTDYEPQMLAWLTRRYPSAVVAEGSAPDPVRRPFEAYFGGEIGALAAVPWRAAGTAFQLGVWQALCEIPPGETLSYAGLAARIGRPTAMRAVGLANGANPIALVAPCHRVIGANKTLTGYGGGLHRKRWLLAHEGASFKDQLAA